MTDLRVTPVFPSLVIELPEWVGAVVAGAAAGLDTPEARMELAIALARENVARGGGPFGAVVVEMASGRIVAPGVNLVVPLGSSLAHAEMVALAVAERVSGCHDLGSEGLPAMELVTSTEPCAMCLGAIPWSGVRGLVCGAAAEDAEAVGFDEGSKPFDWIRELERRGIDVRRGVLREAAADVLRAYARSGGPIYNGRARAR
jgi:tRNA(Arg) A34 adenosine deaminase TadA